MNTVKKLLISFMIAAILTSNTGTEITRAARTSYYSKLNKAQKKAYNKIKAELQKTNKDEKIPITVDTDYKNMLLSLEALLTDMPYFSTGTLELDYSGNMKTTKLIINKINNKKTIRQLKHITDNLNLAGNDEIETLIKIHDYLIDNIEYDITTDNKFNLQGALIEGKAVCEGYARTFKYLCDLYDIPCILVTGTISSPSLPEGSERHMWNCVKLDGAWYIVDVTWDDGYHSEPSEKYAFFLIGEKTFTKDNKRFTDTHKKNKYFFNFDSEKIKGFTYPEISEDSYFGEHSTYSALIESGYLTFMEQKQ